MAHGTAGPGTGAFGGLGWVREAERAVLIAAMACGIKVKGWMSANRRAGPVRAAPANSAANVELAEPPGRTLEGSDRYLTEAADRDLFMQSNA